MTSPQYLRVRNWEKFQHYKDRRPPWIKYHVELLQDFDLTSLDYVTQLLYDRLLLIAALTDNNVPFSSEYIGRIAAIDEQHVAEGVEKLLEQGFLVLCERKRSASKHLARRSAGAIPETETETEKRQRHKEPSRNGIDSSSDLSVWEGPIRPKPLGAGRDEAFALLLSRVTGGDAATPKVLWNFCRKLPQDRIEAVAAKFSKRCVNAGVAVNALKAEIVEFDREVRAGASEILQGVAG